MGPATGVVLTGPLATSLRGCQSVSSSRNVPRIRQIGHRGKHQARRLSGEVRAGSTTLPQTRGSDVVDYYELLGVDDDASVEDIKSAYRYLAKQCHPDYLGNEGHDMCVLLNEAYEVLSNPTDRSRYNARLQQKLQEEKDDFTGQPLSKWMVGKKMGKNTDPAERRAVFVDEVTCIGCKMCVWCASATFRMEPQYGRSRVFAQWLDTEDKIQASIDSCPVSCIHWVDKDELPALEYATQRLVARTDVSMMMAGQGNSSLDVFATAAQFMKQRAKKQKEAAAVAKQYSAAQQAARRNAEDAIKRQSMGWFAGFANAFSDAFANSMSTAASYTSAGGPGRGDDEDLVGRRRRAPRKALNAGGGMVPDERALVPISVYAKEPSEVGM